MARHDGIAVCVFYYEPTERARCLQGLALPLDATEAARLAAGLARDNTTARLATALDVTGHAALEEPLDASSFAILAALGPSLVEGGPGWYSGVEAGARPVCGLTRRLGDLFRGLGGAWGEIGRCHTRVLAMRLRPGTASLLTTPPEGIEGGALCIWFTESAPGTRLMAHGAEVELPGPNSLLVVRGSALDAAEAMGGDGPVVLCVWYLPKPALLAHATDTGEPLSDKRKVGGVLRRLEAALVSSAGAAEDNATAAVEDKGDAGGAFKYQMVVSGEEPHRRLSFVIHTPGLQSAAELDLELSREEIEVSHSTGKKRPPLRVLLPFDVDEEEVSARFEKGCEQLTLELVETGQAVRC